jgi:hypothetical protein
MFDLDIIDRPVNLGDGEWVGDIPNHPGVRFLVRSKNYKPFTVANDRLLRSFGKHASKAASDPEYQRQVGALISEHLLLDWERALTKSGKPVPYDRKLADQVLTSVDDRSMGQTFRDAVAYAASVVADRHLGIADDIAGN